MRSTPPAVYTPALANRALPYVRRLVGDLVRDHAAWRETLAALDAARRAPTTADEVTERAAEMAALRRRAAQFAGDVQAALADLAALGVECKGLDVGLVDFPAVIDGAPACLCWQLGEPSVAWWHRPDAGFAGRQPLDDAVDVTSDAPAAEVPA